MGIIRRSARRAGRRAGRRSALVTSAIVGGAMAASTKKGQAAEAEKAKAEAEDRVAESKEEKNGFDPIKRLKERLANGEITIEEYDKMVKAITK